MAKSKNSVASSTVETVETVETQIQTVAVEEKKKRGRKASETFDAEVGETKVSIKPKIFSPSELTREELEAIAIPKIRGFALYEFKKEMSEKLPKIDVGIAAYNELSQKFPNMTEAEIDALAMIVDKNFCKKVPTEWEYTVEMFRKLPKQEESEEA